MSYCINLCELLNENDIDIILQNDLGVAEYDRVYFGSYFCSRYFLNMSFGEKIVSHFKARDIRLTLVVPVFTEKDLIKAKARIDEILCCGNQYIDEVTVNDIGMLKYIGTKYNSIVVNLGRLFFKGPRDIRLQDFTETRAMIAQLDIPESLNYHSGMCEIDETNDELLVDNEENYKIAVHYPLCYMTTGNICKFAGIHKKIDEKFRPNCYCQAECQNIYEHYHEKLGENVVDLYRIGRTIYFERKNRAVLNVEIDRYIYFPFLEIIKMMGEGYENIGSVK